MTMHPRPTGESHDRLHPSSLEQRPEVPGAGHIGALDLTRWPGQIGHLIHRWATSRTPRAAATWAMALGAAVTTAAAVAAEEVWDQVQEGSGIAGVDRPVLDWMIAHRTGEANRDFTWFTFLGGTIGLPVITVALMVVLSVWMRRWGPIVLLAIGVAGSLGLTIIGKYAVGRHRPPLVDAVAPFESSPSFPSGHTLNATVVAALGAYFLLTCIRRLWGRVVVVATATTFAVCIGLSRVYLGHHWLSDVVMGWVLGILWAGIVITVHRIWLTSERAQMRHRGELDATKQPSEPGDVHAV